MLLNRKCNYCGNEYYVCRACTRNSHWKNVCCSRECFIALESLEGIRPIIIENGENTMPKILLRAELKDYSIVRYLQKCI